MSQNGTSGAQAEEQPKAMEMNPYQERSVEDYITGLWETPSKPAILTWKMVMDTVYEMVFGKESKAPQSDLAGPGNTQKTQSLQTDLEPKPTPENPSFTPTPPAA